MTTERARSGEPQRAPRQSVPDGRKIYDDILPTLDFKKVESWADTRVDHNRKTRVPHGGVHPPEEGPGPLGRPDHWVEECVGGTNRTPIENLRRMKEKVEGPDLEGDTPATRSK